MLKVSEKIPQCQATWDASSLHSIQNIRLRNDRNVYVSLENGNFFIVRQFTRDHCMMDIGQMPYGGEAFSVVWWYGRN